MASLNIPNPIVDGAAVEAVELQQNFDEVETFVNSSILHTDGSTAMTGPLLLNGAATAPSGAVTKSQMEAADTVIADSVTVVAASVTALTSSSAADATAKANAAEAAAVVTANAYTDVNNIESGFKKAGLVGTVTTTGSPQGLQSVTALANTRAGHYVVSVTFDLAVASTNAGAVDTFIGKLMVGGVAHTEQVLWKPPTDTSVQNTRMTLSKTYIIAAAAAGSKTFSTTVEQQAGTSGSYSVYGATHSGLTVLFVG